MILNLERGRIISPEEKIIRKTDDSGEAVSGILHLVLCISLLGMFRKMEQKLLKG